VPGRPWVTWLAGVHVARDGQEHGRELNFPIVTETLVPGNVMAVPRSGTWEPPVTPRSGDAQPLHVIRNFSHAPTLVASEWMVSVIRPPPPTAVR
jgi:hypothetical protein